MTIKEFFESGKNLAIHCDTEEKAGKLLEAFDKVGYKWRTGYSYYADLTCWDMYKKDTCYSNGGGYGEIDWYKSKKYQILEFEEVEFEDASENKEGEKMKRQVSIKLLRELYRVDNKYWKTGDADILPKLSNLAGKIDPNFWCEIESIATIVVRKHLSVDTFIKCLELLGYGIEEEEK